MIMREIYKFIITKTKFLVKLDALLIFFFVFFVINLLFKVDLRDFIPILRDITVIIYDILIKDWIDSFQEYFNLSRVVADIQRWLLSFKEDVSERNIVVVEKTLTPWELFRRAVVF